ncbi:MAG TPA: lipopolysaccharide transport periplasmic protein LptA [bacterium]|nr:lipopolysaccharide transport periplasmic protein LptA [bacterium]
MKRAWTIGWIVMALGPWAAAAQVAGPPGPFEGFKSTDKQPVEIHAGTMEADLNSGRLVFIGRVTARQGERTIYAERIEVNYTEDGKITSLTAIGSVKVKMGAAFATSDRLYLDNVKQVITLTGKPRVVQGRQIVIGDKIVYEIGPERLTVQKPRIEWVPEPETAPVKEPAARPPASKDQGAQPAGRE